MMTGSPFGPGIRDNLFGARAGTSPILLLLLGLRRVWWVIRLLPGRLLVLGLPLGLLLWIVNGMGTHGRSVSPSGIRSGWCHGWGLGGQVRMARGCCPSVLVLFFLTLLFHKKHQYHHCQDHHDCGNYTPDHQHVGTSAVGS